MSCQWANRRGWCWYTFCNQAIALAYLLQAQGPGPCGDGGPHNPGLVLGVAVRNKLPTEVSGPTAITWSYETRAAGSHVQAVKEDA